MSKTVTSIYVDKVVVDALDFFKEKWGMHSRGDVVAALLEVEP